MGTTTPDITKQTTEVGREQTDQNQRFQDLLDQANATLGTQYGQSTAAIAAQLAAQNKLIADQTAQQKTVNDAKEANDAAQLKLQTDSATKAQQVADQNAAQARADATAKAAAISGAQKQVQDAFAGYDDNYYNNYANNYVAGQQPALDQKYDDLQRQTALGFASKGTLDGSAAVRQFGIVSGQKAAEAATLAQQGSDAAAALRTQVADQENQAMQSALFAATLTPEVPIQGLADPKGPAGPASAPGGTPTTAPPGNPTYSVAQPDKGPVAAATVDSSLTGSTAVAPPTPPTPTSQTIYVPGFGQIQIPLFNGESETKAAPGTHADPPATAAVSAAPPTFSTTQQPLAGSGLPGAQADPGGVSTNLSNAAPSSGTTPIVPFDQGNFNVPAGSVPSQTIAKQEVMPAAEATPAKPTLDKQTSGPTVKVT